MTIILCYLLNDEERANLSTRPVMEYDAAISHFDEYGYCVLDHVLDPEQARDLDQSGRRQMTGPGGYVKLEGALNSIPALSGLCEHPEVLRLAEHYLGTPFYICNNVCLMWCQPGAPGGDLHADWPLGEVSEPYPDWPMLLQTMWMLTDFTQDNGGTKLVPGSHKTRRPPHDTQDKDEIAISGTAGSVLIWHGGVWHRNGANTTHDQHRMGANIAYIPRFIHRPRSQWPLIKTHVYDKLSGRMQKLLARSVERHVEISGKE